MLKRPFYLYFPYNLDVKTWFGRNNTNRICDLNSCNGEIIMRKTTCFENEADVSVYGTTVIDINSLNANNLLKLK